MESDASLERALAPVAERTRDASGNVVVRIRRIVQIHNRRTDLPEGPAASSCQPLAR